MRETEREKDRVGKWKEVERREKKKSGENQRERDGQKWEEKEGDAEAAYGLSSV